VATVRITMAEAVVRFLAAQQIDDDIPLFAGVWAIFGHGNVAGLGPALHAARRKLPTLRAHNEQAMAHAAIAFAIAPMTRPTMRAHRRCMGVLSFGLPVRSALLT